MRRSRAAALLVLLGLHMNGFAATGISACDHDSESLGLLDIPESRLSIQPVDYDTSDSDEQEKQDQSTIPASPSLDTSRISLTPSVDTTVTRDIMLQSELELPEAAQSSLINDADPAALLLERRAVDTLDNESKSDDEEPIATRLPGVENETMLEYRKRMFRTDI